MNRFDVVVVGGGHNGLVTAAYLGRAGLRVAVVESRQRLGGPCGGYEFLPGRSLAFTNSPGSLNPAVVSELRLADHGLRFIRADPTVVQQFDGRCFLGWRDPARVDRQLDAFAPGEADRYRGLISDLERLGASLRVSLDDPRPLCAHCGSGWPTRRSTSSSPPSSTAASPGCSTSVSGRTRPRRCSPCWR